MKKLVIFSEESVFSGVIKCGIAEVVDSLALSLAENYDTFVVCKKGELAPAQKIAELVEIEPNIFYDKFLQVHYYLISEEAWPEAAYQIIDKIKPDILHNFDDPALISRLNSIPKQTIYTFDDMEYLKNKIESLKKYNIITTFSKEYTKYVLEQSNSVSQTLRELNFKQVSIGIITEFLDPNNGLFIPYNYNKDSLFGKQVCKKRLLEKLQLNEDYCIFLFMGRLIKQKGIDSIIGAIPFFKNNKIKLIIIGKGEEKYETLFREAPKDSNIIYIEEKFILPQILSFLAGADFYLQPSLIETGGLMPMTASQYGAIPIVTQNGGLKDNFNEENAIIVKENLLDSLNLALELYNDKEKFNEKMRTVMSQEYGWNVRKEEIIQLYEATK